MAGKNKTYELALKIAGKVDSSLKKACSEAEENLSALGDTAKKAGEIAAKATAAAATAAVAVAGKALEVYTEHTKAANGLAATTGAVGEEAKNLQAVMENVYADNFGDDIKDVADAVAKVNTNLSNLSTEELEKATEAALALRDAFGYETEETTRAAAAIEKNFGGSVESAFSLIAAGAQNGLDYSGELIDTINEYSSQFSKLGFTADGMFNLLQSGADSTAWNLDKVGDAIKEFSIRSIDGSDTTVAAFQALGYDTAAIMQTFAAGGEGANKAFYEVINTLMDVDDKVQRDAIGVSLFGTQWEDLGTEAMQAMANASTAAYDTQGALEQINAVKYNDLSSQLEGVKRQAEAALATIGEQLAPYVQEALKYVSDVALPAVTEALGEIIPKIQETVTWFTQNSDVVLALAGAIGTAVIAYKAAKAAMAIYNTVTSVAQVLAAASAAATGGQTAATVAQAAATTGAIAPTTALAVATNALCLPLLAVVAIIAAVVAIVILLVKNWDKVKAVAAAVWDKIVTIWGVVASWFKEKVITPVTNFFSSAVEAVTGFFKKCWETIKAVWKAVSTWFSTNVITPLVNFFTPIIATVSGIFKGLWIIIQAVWKLVSTWFNDNVIIPLVGFFTPIVQTVGGFFVSLWNNIVAIWTAVATWFNNSVITPLVGFFSTVVETVGGFFSTLWDNIVAVWIAVGDWFSENVAEPIKTAFQVVSDFVKGIFNGLLGFVEGMINGVIDAINGLIGGFSNVVGKAADFLGIDWGGISALPNVTLPRLAAGGIAVAPTLAEIGEGSEPEAILPLSKLAALLEEKPKGSGSGNAGNDDGGESIVFSPVFHFHGAAGKADVEEATKVSFEEFKRLYRRLKAEERRKSFTPA